MAVRLRSRRAAPWVLGVALVLTNGFWAYTAVDRAVTIDHHTSEIARQTERAELLASLLVALPREFGPDETEAFLAARYSSEIVKRPDAETVEVGGVVLEFRGDSLVNASVW